MGLIPQFLGKNKVRTLSDSNIDVCSLLQFYGKCPLINFLICEIVVAAVQLTRSTVIIFCLMFPI